jgi:DNA-binding transcriptional LysR family regulator
LPLPRDHPLRGDKLSFAKLLDFDLVGLEKRNEISQLLTDRAAAQQKPLRLRVQVKNFEAACKTIAAGLGIGVLPQASARHVVRAMGLRLVPLADGWASRKTLLCFRDHPELPPAAGHVAEHLLCHEMKS